MKNVDVPLADIKRRFEPSTEKFFKQYRSLADKWILFNNAGSNPEIIAKKQNAHIEVIAEDLFMKITRKIGIAL